MANVYVMFAGSFTYRPTIEVVDQDVASIDSRTIYGWDTKKIFSNPSNQIFSIGFGPRWDVQALEQHFGLPKGINSVDLKTRARDDIKGLHEQYLSLSKGQMVIIVYQKNPSDVFSQLQSTPDKSISVEDFFSFVVYEAKKETLPKWGRNMIQNRHGFRSIRNAISLQNGWYAVWASQTRDSGDSRVGDDYSWTTDYVYLIHPDGRIKLVYSDGYETHNQDGIWEIRLSRSGKSIVITPYGGDPDEEVDEIIIPLSI